MIFVNSVLKQKLSPPISLLASFQKWTTGKSILPVGIYVHWKPKAVICLFTENTLKGGGMRLLFTESSLIICQQNIASSHFRHHCTLSVRLYLFRVKQYDIQSITVQTQILKYYFCPSRHEHWKLCFWISYQIVISLKCCLHVYKKPECIQTASFLRNTGVCMEKSGNVSSIFVSVSRGCF